jgi:hypothetical protein
MSDAERERDLIVAYLKSMAGYLQMFHGPESRDMALGLATAAGRIAANDHRELDPEPQCTELFGARERGQA